MFVTWNLHIPPKEHSEGEKEILRGCIGTFAKEELRKNLSLYSFISAFRDSRFPPISKKEIPFLSATVSLLQEFEIIKDPYDWEVGTHGIQIKFKADGQNYSATFLPEVAKEQGWDQKQTLMELLEKAGYNGKIENVQSVMIVERYQSKIYSAKFIDYIDFITKNKGIFKLSDID